LLKLVETRDEQIAELLTKEPEPAPEPVQAASEGVGAGHAPPAPIAMLMQASEVPPRAHLLFVPTAKRYLLVNMEGPAPAVGKEVALEGGQRFVVSKLAPSPLPADERRCAYLEPA
jgi:hypothetical protein